MKMGVGYRHELARWIDARGCRLGCLEITAEHFFRYPADRLESLATQYPLFVHGLGLSLGTPGPLDPERLADFARVAAQARAQWVSEHVAFTRTPELDLGHLNPLRPTRASAAIVAAHVRELADRCARPVLLENITSHIALAGDYSEPEFLNCVCQAAECGLLLDVTNLFINSRNHRFDPLAWLGQLDLARVRQLHIVGYSTAGGRWTDDHSAPIQPELLELAQWIVDRAPVEAVILERDADFPAPAALDEELAKLESLHARR